MPAITVTHRQPTQPKAGDDPGHDYYECTRGAADLRARTAKCGDQKSSHNSCVQAGLRRDARGDAERHGKRQCHEPNRDPGEQIVEKHVGGVDTKT